MLGTIFQALPFLAQFKIIDKGNGKIGAERVREFTIPSSSDSERSAQTERMVVDQETGFLYIGQEDVGIRKFQAEPNGGTTGKLFLSPKQILFLRRGITPHNLA
ncbi:phytase [Tolypothrix sp. PCC 7910]|nr:phytase [Tolypothrix sp. PCC 7910]QIR38772.1 phytase [Tolypothrix sp. PCC 7910]